MTEAPTVVGRRSYRNTWALMRDISTRMEFATCPLIVTGGFDFYEKVIRRVFGPAVLLGQVLKTRRHDRIVQVDRRERMGASWRFEAGLTHSEDSSTLNTSFIERMNLTIRQGSAYLSRRTLSHARSEDKLEEHLELLRCHYNFVRPHGALKFHQLVIHALYVGEQIFTAKHNHLNRRVVFAQATNLPNIDTGGHVSTTVEHLTVRQSCRPGLVPRQFGRDGFVELTGGRPMTPMGGRGATLGPRTCWHAAARVRTSRLLGHPDPACGAVATCRVEAQRANLPPLSDQCSGTRVDRARPSGSARCTRGALRSAALLPSGLAEQVR